MSNLRVDSLSSRVVPLHAVPKDAALLFDAIDGGNSADPVGPIPEALDEVGLPIEPTPSFDDTVKMAAELTGSPMAAVTVLDADYQWFKAKVGIPLRATRRDVSFCHYTVEHSGVFDVPDALADERFKTSPLVTDGLGVRSYAGAPLVMPDGRCVGAICVFDVKPRQFGSAERQALELLSRLVVSQLQLEQVVHRQAEDIEDLREARAEMLHMAMHDELTGLLNRRGVISAVDQRSCIHPSMSRSRPVGASALFLDLDDFKRINDNHGHDIGDQVLIEVANRLAATANSRHIVGRLGGDEFIVWMAGATEPESTLMAEQILQAVQRPMLIDGITTVVQASIGLAATSEIGNVLGVIDRADQAMYVSKQAGGNQLAAWTTEPGVASGQ